MGALTTGGPGQTDIGNKHVIGGLSREFYRRVFRHYTNAAAWTWQSREDYTPKPQTRIDAGDDTMWTFEPSVARHLLYQQGLMWTLANHPRVPEHVRKEVSRWMTTVPCRTWTMTNSSPVCWPTSRCWKPPGSV